MIIQEKKIYSPPFAGKVWIFLVKFFCLLLKPMYWITKILHKLLEGINHHLKIITFPINKDDIFIVTYPKSGTTWVQMILYQLTTDGNMEFDHISQKIPFFERKINYENIDSPSGASRRIFKTHLGYLFIPKGPCKYIYVIRDGRDVAVSYYHHYRSLAKFNAPFNIFFKLFIQGKIHQYGSWFKHVCHWYRNRAGLDVLYLSYEALQKGLPKAVRQIAQFCEIPVDEERLNRVLERSSFSYMKAHEEKFEHITEIIMDNGWIKGKFIRKGKTGGWTSYFTPSQEEIYNAQYKKWIEGKAMMKLKRKN